VPTTDPLARALDLAARNVAAGGGPFGAVIVLPDGSMVDGVNRVTLDNDPTAHAEVVAIRAASARLGTFDLSGCSLYSSCEPCPMCGAAALWARLDTVVFAADRHDAAAAGFDDSAFYALFEQPGGEWPTVLRHEASPERLAPFEAWARFAERTEY
jgi:guanine deaminase